MDGERILVVEDDPDAAENVRLILKSFDYRVAAIAGTAETAFETLRENNVDLVLMDVGLPGELDGVEAGRRIMAEHDIPVVFLTGMTDDRTLGRIEESAPYGYLPKPCSPRHLKTALQLALSRRGLEEALREREERFRLLIENSRDIITVLAADATIRYESPSVEPVLGYAPEDLKGRDAFEFVHPHDIEAAREAFESVLRKPGQPLTLELRFRHADGTWRILEATGNAFHNGKHGLRIVVNSRDVTGARRAAEALRTSEERYRRLFEENLAGVFRRTLEGELLEVNEAFARILGYDSPGEMVGLHVGEVAISNEEFRTFERRLRSEGTVVNAELQVRRRDGARIWVLASASLQEESDRRARVVTGTVIDISRQKWLAAELERMAFQDPLTGLANRRALEKQARRILALAQRRGVQAGLIYLDLTRFKRINDSLGHSVGDEVLVETARRLRRGARESDLVARVGGDEFAVLLAEVAGDEGAVAAAERLTRGFDDAIEVAGRRFHVGAQMGVALFPDHASDFPGLLTAADRAMYRSKANRDVPVTIYRPQGEGTPVDELSLEEELRTAVREKQFVLHYQPILEVSSGKRVGAEALIRWLHPQRGLLNAGEFVRFVEGTAMMGRLDRWVASTALRQLADWKGPGAPEWVAINLSASTLWDRRFLRELSDLLKADGTVEGRLVVEVTEHAAIRDLKRTGSRLDALRDLGVAIALDDFGTGHSALAYLKHLPADILKIGGQFIHDLDRNPEKATLAQAVIRLGQAVGLTLVTEEVEREAQEEWVRESGCDLVQGYFIGRPVPPEEFPGLPGRADDASLTASAG